MDSASVFGQKGLMAGVGLQGLKITGITPDREVVTNYLNVHQDILETFVD
jgi:hypothetical protein